MYRIDGSPGCIFYGIMLICGLFSAPGSARDLWVSYGKDLYKFRGMNVDI